MTYEEAVAAIKTIEDSIEVAKLRYPALEEKIKAESKNSGNAYKDFINYMRGEFTEVTVEYSKAIRALEADPTVELFAIVQQRFQAATVVRQKFENLDKIRHEANARWSEAFNLKKLNDEAILELQNKIQQLHSYMLLVVLVELIS